MPQPKKVWLNGLDLGTREIANQGSCTDPIEVTPLSLGISQIRLLPTGELGFNWQSHSVQTQLIGQQYVATVALAIEVAKYFGLSDEEITAGLSSFVPNVAFISQYQTQTGLNVIDDGKTSNPAGFKAALELLTYIKTKTAPRKSLLITSGIVDLGKESHRIHQELASAAKLGVDQVLYTGQDGLEEFKSVFNADCIFQPDEIKKILTQTSSADLLLIEGSVPGWIQPLLNRKDS